MDALGIFSFSLGGAMIVIFGAQLIYDAINYHKEDKYDDKE